MKGFCNAHVCIKEEKIIDRQLNKTINISFNRNNTSTENMTEIIAVRNTAGLAITENLFLTEVRPTFYPFDNYPSTNVHRTNVPF